MFDLSLGQILVRLVAFAVVTGVLGFVLAGCARLMGDHGPSHDGRVTASPAAHLDLLGLVAAIGSRAGWIRPIDLEASALRLGRFGLVLAVLVALVATVLLGYVAFRLRSPMLAVMPADYTTYALLLLNALGEVAVYTAVLNVIPLPPLAGGYVLAAVAPALAKVLFHRSLWVSLVLVVVMVWTRGAWLRPVAEPILAALR